MTRIGRLLLLLTVLAIGCGGPPPAEPETGGPVDLARHHSGPGLERYEADLATAEETVRSCEFGGSRLPDGRLDIVPDFDCGRVQRVLVRARMSDGNRGHLRWVTAEDPAYDNGRSIQFWLHPGDAFRTYTIEVGEDPEWGPGITGLRLEPIDVPGTVELESVVFMAGLNRLERDLLAARCGVPDASLELGEDRRRVLALAPGRPVSLEVAVPRSAPELRFATGLSRPGAAHRFRVATGDGVTLFERDHRHPGWREARVDLGRFAGETITLSLETEPLGEAGEGDCLPLLANPLIHPGGGSKPNVLVILVDALRTDKLGCYGHHGRLTPHIDRLRRESLLFRGAQASSSWTAPSVASLFTGLHPYQHGVRYVDTLELEARFDTLAESFDTAGWFTGAISDNMLITPENGFQQGFRTFVSKPSDGGERKATEVTDLALGWLDHHGDRPFLLYLHYMDPHANYQPREPFHPGPNPPGVKIRPFVERGEAGGVANRRREIEGFELSRAEEERLLLLYEAEIAATDFELGRLLAYLTKTGLHRNTIVVFVADHGEEFLDHGMYTHATSLYDELVRVPLLLRRPGTGPGPGLDEVVRAADLGPTLLELAGAGGMDGSEGRSFAGLLNGGDAGADREAYFELNPYSRNPLAEGWIEATRGVRLGRYKLIHEVRTGRYRLYDMETDPGERRSIYDEDDPRAEELVRRLARHLEADEGVDLPLLDDRQLQQLDAMGYLDR